MNTDDIEIPFPPNRQYLEGYGETERSKARQRIWEANMRAAERRLQARKQMDDRTESDT